jgi:hypothetical protein
MNGLYCFYLFDEVERTLKDRECVGFCQSGSCAV